MEVNTRYGPILMDINNSHYDAHANLEFEKKFVEVIENDKYDVFVDVGAAWGYFSIPASHYCKVVYAFEPTKKRYDLLKQNIEVLSIDNIKLSRRAVGTGLYNLYEGRYAGPKGKRRSRKLEANWITIKEILEPHLDEITIVKIDVEGMELDVIKSAGNLSQYDNVTWLIERHQWGYSEEELRNALKPFTGELTGVRKRTSHWIFRR